MLDVSPSPTPGLLTSIEPRLPGEMSWCLSLVHGCSRRLSPTDQSDSGRRCRYSLVAPSAPRLFGSEVGRPARYRSPSPGSCVMPTECELGRSPVAARWS